MVELCALATDSPSATGGPEPSHRMRLRLVRSAGVLGVGVIRSFNSSGPGIPGSPGKGSVLSPPVLAPIAGPRWPRGTLSPKARTIGTDERLDSWVSSLSFRRLQ